MRALSVSLLALATAAFIGATAGPAAAEQPQYPVICIYNYLPDGTPLPVICIPDPR